MKHILLSLIPCAGADEYNEIYAVGELKAVGMTAYPNPSQGLVTIVVGEASGFEYQVMDMMGRVVLKGTTSNEMVTIALDGLAKGVCLVSVTTGTNHLTQKVIVR